MARIKGVDIPNNKRTVIALTYIYGIGKSLATKICKDAGVDENIRAKDLTNEQVAALRDEVNKYLTEGDLRREVNMNIKTKMEIVAGDMTTCQRGQEYCLLFYSEKNDKDFIVTIDNSKDVNKDDAFSVKRIDDDLYNLKVYIADPNSLFSNSSISMKDARNNAETIYLSDKEIEMFHPLVVNNYFLPLLFLVF